MSHSPYTLHWLHRYPPNVPLPVKDLELHLLHDSLDPLDPLCETELDRVSRFSTIHTHYQRTDRRTERPTERTRKSIFSKRPFTICSWRTLRRGLWKT